MPPKSKASKLRAAEKRVQSQPNTTSSSSTESPRLGHELSITGEGSQISTTPLQPSFNYPSTSSTSSESCPPSVEAAKGLSETCGTAKDRVPAGEGKSSSKTKEETLPSQTTQLINEFEASIPRLLDLLLDAEARIDGIGSPCKCGRGRKVATCFECKQYPITCVHCFTNDHLRSPLHWAEVWNSDLQVFVRHDISTLDPAFSNAMGHGGHVCPHAVSDPGNRPLDMTLVDINGIHRTRVRFCSCAGTPDRVDQLITAGFFPASLKRPRTAFSLGVLESFHRFQLEGKLSAYDFCSTLRRATDDVFTESVPDIFPQFIVVMQIWRVLVAIKRLGQSHGIDKVLRHRRAGNLVVHCPVCPEPQFNVDEGWGDIPELLRHLCQLQLTADGNHQANRYLKNTDPLSRSIFGGRGYFPTDEQLQKHLLRSLSDLAEKVTCKHLNASEKQDRKKFKNMDITGIVSIQCSHVFVKSSVDLQLGERFVNTDLAFNYALQLYRILDPANQSLRYITSRDLILSYDIACGYLKNIVTRFEAAFSSEMVEVIRRIRGIIPAVHIQNHQDNCMYLYSGAYTENIGHFHGETAEQVWVELNQLAAQIRQMNNGHRQDCIIDSHGDWNWKKMKRMFLSLYAEITHARATYIQHKENFNALCRLYADRLIGWNEEDRSKRTLRGKDVECVYRHSKHKVPSQKAITESLLKTNEAVKLVLKGQDGRDEEFSNIDFVGEGILIQCAQRDIERKTLAMASNPTSTAESELSAETSKLSKRLSWWRSQQRLLMPQVSADVLTEVAEERPVSKERLFLPSDYETTHRSKLSLDSLAAIESRLREGFAFDAIKAIQQHVKSIDLLKIDKRVNARGQDQNTRSNARITRVVAERDGWIDHYNLNRQAMISLAYPNMSRSFPTLTVNDTHRRTVAMKRVLGDSRRFDGRLWTLQSQDTVAGSTQGVFPPPFFPLPCSGDVSTQGAHKVEKSRHTPSTKNDDASPKTDATIDATVDAPGSLSTEDGTADPHPSVQQASSKVMSVEDGWIWRLGAIGNLSAAEVDEWEREGDKVHWFRAEAEMERWREQWEIKLIEFIRCSRSFSSMAETWATLSRSSPPSYSVYARKKSAMYNQLRYDVEAKFVEVMYSEPTQYIRGEDIVTYILRHRSTEIGSFHPQYRVRIFRALENDAIDGSTIV